MIGTSSQFRGAGELGANIAMYSTPILGGALAVSSGAEILSKYNYSPNSFWKKSSLEIGRAHV